MATQPPERILIIDDEPDIALILKLHLKQSGYISDWASDGESGLKLLHSNAYNLVLLDVSMPGISGTEVLRRMQSEDLDAAVVMMTAHGNENLVTECMKAGASDYVGKPFDIDDLLHRIDKAISNRRTLREKKLLEQEKEDFFFMLSHDLKNPLTAVVGSIDLVREGRLGPVNHEQTDYLQSAVESCEEVVAMIDNLLDTQRFNTGMIQPALTQVNLSTLLATAVRRFAPAAEREHIILSLEIPASLPKIIADASLMARVLANLIGNALKFTPEGGLITVSCSCRENSNLDSMNIPAYATMPTGLSEIHCFVRISVSDTGNGIAPDELSTIFRRYVQARNSSRRGGGGAGLGLAFCKKALESFKGCIWVESVEDQGSEFIILLPCYNAQCTSTHQQQEIL